MVIDAGAVLQPELTRLCLTEPVESIEAQWSAAITRIVGCLGSHSNSTVEHFGERDEEAATSAIARRTTMTASTAQPDDRSGPPPHEELQASESTVATEARPPAIKPLVARIRRKIGRGARSFRARATSSARAGALAGSAKLTNRIGANTPTNHLDEVDAPDVDEVKGHYEAQGDLYLEAYGEIVQAARQESDDAFLAYLARSIGVEDGMRLLDAGCGVCGPATAFARQNDVHIDALTISERQVELSNLRIEAAELDDRVVVRAGNFELLGQLYPAESFDTVFFLESLGYASSLESTIDGAYDVIKQFGHIYIKDFFPVVQPDATKRDQQTAVTRAIRAEYQYRLLDLVNTVTALSSKGFMPVFIRQLDVVEDFTRAIDFENRSGFRSYHAAISSPFQLYQSLELKFQKVG